MDFQSEHIPISLSFSQLVEAVKQLSVEEKTVLEDEMWMDTQLNDFSISEEDKKTVLERVARAEKDPSTMLSFDELKSNISKQYGF